MASARILTIIVAYNGLRWMDSCLGSLRRSEYATDVILIDNCSTDGTPEYVRAHFPEIMLVLSEENLGFGKANNIGLRHALDNGYDYVYLLNQDAWVMPETLGQLVEAMEAHPEYGILSPVQMTASLERMDRNFQEKCISSSRNYEDGRVYEVDFVMAAHWMLSRKCLVAVGGFSPVFPHYGEDDNYIHRAYYHGFRTGFLAGAYAVHDRDERPYAKETAMKRKLVAARVNVCNPNRSLLRAMILQPVEMFAIALFHMSWTVIAAIPVLVKEYPFLSACRRQSEDTGAFL